MMPSSTRRSPGSAGDRAGARGPASAVLDEASPAGGECSISSKVTSPTSTAPASSAPAALSRRGMAYTRRRVPPGDPGGAGAGPVRGAGDVLAQQYRMSDNRPILTTPATIEELQADGLLELGEGVVIEENVELCHPTRAGERRPVRIGAGCRLRSWTVLYSGVELGAYCQTGHHVMVRENVVAGHHTVLGTGATCEFGTRLGNHVLLETNAYVTARMIVEDDVFIGPGVVTTNDRLMLWRRAGAGQQLAGPVLRRGCRIGGAAVLLPGVEIGPLAVVGAGAVVVSDVPERELVVGNPARLVRILAEDADPLLPPA